MKSLIRLFGFLIVLTTALSAATVRLGSGAKSMGQTVVKIRVIDADNGHPVQTQQVSVSMFFEKDEKAQPQDNVNLNLKTDANGEVQFELPQPAPAHLSAQVHLNQKKWRCGCMALVVSNRK